MATTQRGINIPVTGQFQDGDDIVNALIAQGMSVDAAIGTAVGEANNYTDAALEQLDIESALIVVSGGTVNLDDSLPVGTLLGYKVTATTTIEGFSFDPGDYVFTRTADGWEYRALAPATPIGAVPDDTPPIGGTLSTSNVTGSSFRMTVTGASDPDSGLHPSPYRFSVNGGSTWSAWQSSNVYDATDLTPSTTYQPRAQVRNNALPTPLSTTVSAADVTTLVDGDILDTFTAEDNTPLNGRTTEVGGKTWISPAPNWRAGTAVAGSGVILGNRVYANNLDGGNSPSAKLDPGSLNVRVGLTYDLGAAATSSQVRIGVRGSLGNNNIGIVAYVRHDGVYGGEYASGSSAIPGWAGTGAPASGTMVLEVVDGVITFFLNGEEIGTYVTESVEPCVGFSTFAGESAVDDFWVILL